MTMDKKMDKKKLAAAIAGVFAYMKTNEEAGALQILEEEKSMSQGQALAVLPDVSMNLWGVSGRQALMQAGNMMQMRMFR